MLRVRILLVPFCALRKTLFMRLQVCNVESSDNLNWQRMPPQQQRWQNPLHHGLTCTKAGETALQADCEEFDSLWVHFPKELAA
jgi:hypothetical protein